MHFLRDTEDDALRQFIYHRVSHEPTRWLWFEAIAMVGTFNRSGFRHLRRVLRIDKRAKAGTVECVYKGEIVTGVCRRESEDDIAIYFSDDRPALRNKLAESSGSART